MLGLKLNHVSKRGHIWQHSTGSTLTQVIACCLKAPSHYPDQCWLISKVPWHSSGVIVIRYEDTNQVHKIEYYIFKITSRSPKHKCVTVLSFQQMLRWVIQSVIYCVYQLCKTFLCTWSSETLYGYQFTTFSLFICLTKCWTSRGNG